MSRTRAPTAAAATRTRLGTRLGAVAGAVVGLDEARCCHPAPPRSLSRGASLWLPFDGGRVRRRRPGLGGRICRIRWRTRAGRPGHLRERPGDDIIVSSRLVSSRLVSSRLVSSRLVSTRLGSARRVSSRPVSSRLVSSRLVSSRLVSSRLVSSRLVSSRLVSSSSMARAARGRPAPRTRPSSRWGLSRALSTVSTRGAGRGVKTCDHLRAVPARGLRADGDQARLRRGWMWRMHGRRGARSQCRFALPLIHFIPDSLIFGATSISETTLRPNPRSPSRTGTRRRARRRTAASTPASRRSTGGGARATRTAFRTVVRC
jgi:hypothetical protein